MWFCQPSYAATLVTELSSDQVAAGDSIGVTFKYQGDEKKITPDFSPLQQDFQILDTNFGKAVNMINGVTTVETFWRLQLMPLHSGELTIPAMTFGNERSAAKKVLVTSGGATPQPQPNSGNRNNLGELVAVQGEISPKVPYVQSQLLYKFKLFFRTQLSNPQIEMPQLNDMTMVQLADVNSYQTTRAGQTYNVIEKTFALFPQKAGVYTIPPVHFHALALENNIAAWNDPFNLSMPKMVDVATKNIVVQVQDIPAAHKKNWLPAKNVTLQQEWSTPTNTWEAGVPVTRTIRIEAQGLRADQLPDLKITQLDGVTIYSDKAKRSNNIDKSDVTGILEQKITYLVSASRSVPQSSITLPAVILNWWNTQTQSAATAQLNALTIRLELPATAAKTSTPTTLPGLAKPPATVASSARPNPPVAAPFYHSVWFWLTCILLFIWLLTLLVVMRRNKPVAAIIKSKPQSASVPTMTYQDDTFREACHAGQANRAQQLLLAWAKKIGCHPTVNLTSLQKLISDEELNSAIAELEHAIYAKNTHAWQGAMLYEKFVAYNKSQAKYKNDKAQTKIISKVTASASTDNNDLLPPLHPLPKK